MNKQGKSSFNRSEIQDNPHWKTKERVEHGLWLNVQEANQEKLRV